MNGGKLRKAKRYIVDVVATTAVTTPVLAGLETLVAGMSTEVSLKARAIGVGLAVGGVATLFTYGREYFKKLFKNNNGIPPFRYDAQYAAFFALATSPFFLWCCRIK